MMLTEEDADMTRFNQITARRVAMGLSVAMLALVATADAGHAQTKLNNGLKINANQGSRQIVVERANGGNKAKTGNTTGGTATTFFVPPKAEPAKKPNNNPPLTAQFVPPKATPVKSSGNGGGNQVLKFEAPKAPRVSTQPTVKVAANTPAAQVALAPEVKSEAEETTAEAAPAPEVTPKVKVKVVAPKVVVTAPRTYYRGYAPYPRYYGSYGSYGGGYSNCH
jgi:hypothetical protein